MKTMNNTMNTKELVGNTLLKGQTQICSCGNNQCDCDCEICPYHREYHLDIKVEKARERKRVIQLDCSKKLSFIVPKDSEAKLDWKGGLPLQVDPCIDHHAGSSHLFCQAEIVGEHSWDKHLYVRPCSKGAATDVLVVVERTDYTVHGDEEMPKHDWYQVITSHAEDEDGNSGCGDNFFELWVFEYYPELDSQFQILREKMEKMEADMEASWSKFIKEFRAMKQFVLPV